MVSTATLAEIGSLLGDPARVNMMVALIDGRARTARELADAGGVTPQTASSHLARLVAAQMVSVEKQGRHRYHRIASAEVAQLLEQMHLMGAAIVSAKARARGPRDPALRELRSCYDHLAGRIAVELSERLVQEPSSPGCPLIRPEAEARLNLINVDLQSLSRGRRPLCRTCIDWSERRPHLSGALGAAILQQLRQLGWVKNRQASRALILTGTGERGLAEVFGIEAIRSQH